MAGEPKRSVLGRVFEVLDCFDRADPEQSISEVCRRTGLPSATVHRLLASLVEWGAVERTSRGCYRLGTHLWSLGHRVPEERQLRDVARPHLVDLHSSLRLPVMLVSRERDQAILMDSITGRAHQGVWSQDRTAPLAEHPAGLAIMAYAAGARGVDGEVTDLRLRRRLGEVRRAGHVVGTYGSPVPTLWVAAPIHDLERAVHKSLAVALPGATSVPAALPALVQQAAANITDDLRQAQRVAQEA